MEELTINVDYLRMLILKVRALMAKDQTSMPDPGGNPTDDEVPETLQELPDDLSREEVIEEIDGLDLIKQAELVALMWIGRGDSEPENWPEALELAQERREVSTSQYLLDHPMVADHWAEALERLGYGGMVEGVEALRT